MEGRSNLGDGKNGGNYIGGSYMPTNNVDLVDQHCKNISGWAVTQRFDYMYHCSFKFLLIVHKFLFITFKFNPIAIIKVELISRNVHLTEKKF